MSVLIKIPVKSFRRVTTGDTTLFDGLGEGLEPRIYTSVMEVDNVPSEIADWLEVNPRDAHLGTTVTKKIADSLTNTPEWFLFKNRGLTLIVNRVHFDNKNNVIELELSNKKLHGLLDGGHTYKVIRQLLETADGESYPALIKLEILEGIEDQLTAIDIVEARNTSMQVREQSLENLRGSYDQIKKVLEEANPNYAATVSYKEFDVDEDGRRKSNDVKDLLSYLMCLNTFAYTEDQHPVLAYSSKARVVAHFSSHPEQLAKLIPLLPVAIELFETIYHEMPETHNGGSGTGKKGRFGKFTGVKTLKHGTTLPYTFAESDYIIPDGFLYPVLASFRAILAEKDGSLVWKEDPIKFWNTVKDDLVNRITERAFEYRNPNKLGKDTAAWRSCYDSVSLSAFRRNMA
jgi:hypothetical protein